jgi:translocation and assembly module TamB
MKALFGLLGVLLLLLVLALAGADIALNTSAGRHFAETEINQLAAGRVTVTGLAGHFPEDIKLAGFTVADANGVWLTGQTAELRWRIAPLLHRDLHVTSLTAASVNVARAPAASGGQPGGSSSPPKFHLNIDHFAIGTLTLPASLAGQAETLTLSGATHVANVTNAQLSLQAATADRQSHYTINGAITDKTVTLTAAIAEPPDGPLGHFAGPQVHDPLNINLAMRGPRDAANLTFTAALGTAQLNGEGTLDLNPDAPAADVTLKIPALAPYGALAGKTIGGATALHLVVASGPDGASLALDGDVALTAAPEHLVALVGNQGHLSLRMVLANQMAEIETLQVSGAAFSMGITGTVAQNGVDLGTHIQLTQVGAVSPGLSGSVTEDGTIIGTAQNFAVAGALNGNIRTNGTQSGPFSITINAQNLPNAPSGTVTGSGALEGFPLLLDAGFAVKADHSARIVINNALWRSLSASADLSLAPGQTLPIGTANFAIGSLADFAAFSPVRLAGSVSGSFAHPGAERFALNLDAHNLLVDPRLGVVNAKLAANGPVDALSVQLDGTVPHLYGSAARLSTAGVVNLTASSATLSALTASWHSLNAVLRGPVGVETKPNYTLHHLALGLNGGSVAVDGTLYPALNARISLQNMPAALVTLFAKNIPATGTIAATANVTGTVQNPAGSFTLQARNMRLHTGPAAGLPAASLDATAKVANQQAAVEGDLTLGADANLTAKGSVALTATGQNHLALDGQTDLRLIDPILAVSGSSLRGHVAVALTIAGTDRSPSVTGTASLADGSFQNISSGLSLTAISAALAGDGKTIDLTSLTTTAGHGSITGHGTVDLAGADMPIDMHLYAAHATPVSSDTLTEVLDAALSLTGALKGEMTLGGTMNIRSANINIPKSLPPTVANLPILYAGEKPPPPPPPAPPFHLNLTLTAKNQIFVRGDGLFAELGGTLRLTGTAAAPVPEGGFDLIRGQFTLAGDNLQFTSGKISFNGGGFVPALDLEASTVTTDNNSTATLVVGGTAAKPTITLTSSPPLPSDEILAQLLFGQSATSLTAFQAASLAAALAQLSGIGGGSNPLDSVRNALGLDQLSLSGSGSGPPSIEAGRYVAPGVYVGATQATNGQGTQATVQVNLYKGLKLQTSTGTSGGGAGDSSSVGLTYQFNY